MPGWFIAISWAACWLDRLWAEGSGIWGIPADCGMPGWGIPEYICLTLAPVQKVRGVWESNRIVRHNLPCRVRVHGWLIGPWLASINRRCWLAVRHATVRIINSWLSAVVDRGTVTLDWWRTVVGIVPSGRRITSITSRWGDWNCLTLRGSSRDRCSEIIRSWGRSLPTGLSATDLGFLSAGTYIMVRGSLRMRNLTP